MATNTMNKKTREEVVDGSDIVELVENKEVFNNFVDHKFRELDDDGDGVLSLQELQPAVEDIGAALGLPPRGTSPDSDHIYSEVMNEFTHAGKKVSKIEFQEVLSDILIGMAAGLKRDPVVILRIDGEDLLTFIQNPSFEPEMTSLLSEMNLPKGSLKDQIKNALKNLTVDRGMPPADPWVVNNIIEPAVESCNAQEGTKFLEEFKRVAENVVRILKERPVIVAHTENKFEGSGIKKLLSDKHELDNALDSTLESLPKDRHGRLSKEFLRPAIDAVAPSAGLPPFGALVEVDQMLVEVFKMCNADDGKLVKEEEFKKMMIEILGSLMLQLEGSPVSVSSDSVVHDPHSSSSLLLP